MFLLVRSPFQKRSRCILLSNDLLRWDQSKYTNVQGGPVLFDQDAQVYTGRPELCAYYMLNCRLLNLNMWIRWSECTCSAFVRLKTFFLSVFYWKSLYCVLAWSSNYWFNKMWIKINHYSTHRQLAPSPIPSPLGSLGHHRWPLNQFSPVFSVLHCLVSWVSAEYR